MSRHFIRVVCFIFTSSISFASGIGLEEIFHTEVGCFTVISSEAQKVEIVSASPTSDGNFTDVESPPGTSSEEQNPVSKSFGTLPDLSIEDFFDLKPALQETEFMNLIRPSLPKDFKKDTPLALIVELDLSRQKLTLEEVLTLIDGLKLLPNLVVFNLSGSIRCPNSDPETSVIKPLCASLSHLTKLRFLDLSSNLLRPFTAPWLANMTSKLTLEELVVDTNLLGVAGVENLTFEIAKSVTSSLSIYIGSNFTNGLKLESLSTKNVTVRDFRKL